MLFTRGRRGRDGDRLASLQAENETLRAEIKRRDEESSRLRGEIGTREERIGRLGAESEERGNSVALLRTHIENLHAFSKKLVSIGTLDEIYRFVADVCIEVFEFDRINILAADEEAKMLRCVEARGNLDEPREKIRAPIGPEAGALYWSYAEGRVIVLDLGTKEAPQKVPEKYYIRPPWSDIRAFRSQSFIIGALLGREKPVGVFAIDKKLRRRRVTPDDIGLVKLLRDIASYAIQNVQTVEGLKVRQAGIYDLIRTSLGAATQGKEKAERTYVANQRLMDSSKRIAGITGAIEDLADRTNLLSLNAAIEAARAGDAGRGFGVVADEVKRLAGQTRESTREIGAVIEHIATEILSSGEAMNEIVSAQKNLIGSIEVLHEKASRLV